MHAYCKCSLYMYYPRASVCVLWHLYKSVTKCFWLIIHTCTCIYFSVTKCLYELAIRLTSLTQPTTCNLCLSQFTKTTKQQVGIKDVYICHVYEKPIDQLISNAHGSFWMLLFFQSSKHNELDKTIRVCCLYFNLYWLHL